MILQTRRRVQTPKEYPEEFKREAIRSSEQDGRTCVGVATSSALTHVNKRYRWRSEAREHGDDAFPGKGKMSRKTVL
jgi:transposase-like protein